MLPQAMRLDRPEGERTHVHGEDLRSAARIAGGTGCGLRGYLI